MTKWNGLWSLLGVVPSVHHIETNVKYDEIRVGPAIWGLQNREKGPKYFSKKGYLGHKTGQQKPDVKESFDVEEHFNSKKWWIIWQ